MPNAAGSLRRAAAQRHAASGVALAGRVQVTPASPLTDMPARVLTRPSYQDVAGHDVVVARRHRHVPGHHRQVAVEARPRGAAVGRLEQAAVLASRVVDLIVPGWPPAR